MEYRGIEIQLSEAKTYMVDVEDQDYTVERSDGLVYQASSKYGSSYATNPQDALTGAQKQIDEAV
jgi:hypothetical protein